MNISTIRQRFVHELHAPTLLPDDRRTAPNRSGRRVDRRPLPVSVVVPDQGIHACHFAGLAVTHALPASSGVMFLFVMASATEFWSSLAHLKFLIRV